MQYYHILITVLKPFTGGEPGGPERNDIATPLFGTPPAKLFLEARACAETLFRVYYLRHGFEYLDSSLLAFVPPLIFMSIEDIESGRRENSPEVIAKQSTALLLSKAIYDQGKSYFLAQVIFALVRDRMPARDFDMVRQFVRVEELEDLEGEEHVDTVRSQWPVDIMGVADNPDMNRLSVLLEQQREMSTRSSTRPSTSASGSL
jgi:hypothetical protein